jgi:hypothetical protein
MLQELARIWYGEKKKITLRAYPYVVEGSRQKKGNGMEKKQVVICEADKQQKILIFRP